MHDTPVTLVAAPGANKAIFPVAMVAKSHDGAPYNFNAQSFVMSLGSTSLINAAGIRLDSMMSGATNGVNLVDIPAFTFQNDYDDGANIENKPITLSIGVNPTGGTGTLTVTLYYSVADTT
jgi:hypothetical protein